MRRLSIACAAAVCFIGCRNQTSSLSNPFLTPDRVPPPSTRTVAPGSAQPYYPSPAGTAPPTGSAAPAYGAPAAAAPQGSTFPPAGATPQPTLPPSTPAGTGNYQYNYGPPLQGAVSPSVDFRQVDREAVNGPSNSLTGNRTVAMGEQIRVPTDDGAMRFDLPAGATSTPQQVFTSQSTAASDSISTPRGPPLPPAVSLTAANLRMPIQNLISQESRENHATYTGLASSGQIQQTGYSAAVGGEPRAGLASATVPSTADSRSGSGGEDHSGAVPTTANSDYANRSVDQRFGAAADASWLRGRLEHLPNTNQWLIRFHPSGRAAGASGGLAVVTNPQVLGDLQPGDYVVLHGHWDQRVAANASGAPSYRVSIVQRQQH